MLILIFSFLILTEGTRFVHSAGSINSISKKAPNDASVKPLVASLCNQNTDVGLKLLRAIHKIDTQPVYTFTNDSSYSVKRPENTIISPIGLFKTLYMLVLGAGGVSKVEFSNFLLGTDVFPPEMHQYFKDLKDLVLKNPTGKSSKYSYETSTTIAWVTKMFLDLKFGVHPTFAKDLEKYYAAETESINFEEGNGEKARNIINTWVADQTGGKIDRVLSAPVPNSLSRMLLLNVFYFKAKWEIPFKKSLTILNDTFFAAQENIIVRVPMLHNPHVTLKLNFLEELNAEYIEMPFVNKKVSMYVVLPIENQGLPFLLQNIRPHHIEKMTEPGDTLQIDLKLPKLIITTNLDAKAHLKKLGLRTIFDSKVANFTGISDIKELFVSEFRQTSVIEIHEEGAEAASVTSVELSERSGPYPFAVDHPFMYFLYDNEAKVILFAGTVWNPATDAMVSEPYSPNKILTDKIEGVIQAIKENLDTTNSSFTAINPLKEGTGVQDKSVYDPDNSTLNDGNPENSTIIDGKDFDNPYFVPYINPAVLKQLTDLLRKIQANFTNQKSPIRANF